MIICFVRLSIFRLIESILFTRFIKKNNEIEELKARYCFFLFLILTWTHEQFIGPLICYDLHVLMRREPEGRHVRTPGEQSRAGGRPPAWHGNKDQLLVWLGTAVNTPRPGLPLKPPMLTPQRRSVLDDSLVQCTLIVTVKQSCSQQRRQCLPVFGSSFALITIVC